MPRARWRLAVDIGGTFTDVAIGVADDTFTAKVLTVADDPVEGVLEAVESALASAGISAADVGSIVHGTTLATNAFIEGKGSRVGAVTTAGFRDILEIGYERRY